MLLYFNFTVNENEHYIPKCIVDLGINGLTNTHNYNGNILLSPFKRCFTVTDLL